MNNTVKLAVATTGVALVAYESLRGGINQCIEKYVPEPVAKYVTPLVTGGVVLAAVGVGLSYAGIDVAAAARALSSVVSSNAGVSGFGGKAPAAPSLTMNPSGGDIHTQITTLGGALQNLIFSGGVQAINQLECKGADILGYVSPEGHNIATVTYTFPTSN